MSSPTKANSTSQFARTRTCSTCMISSLFDQAMAKGPMFASVKASNLRASDRSVGSKARSIQPKSFGCFKVKYSFLGGVYYAQMRQEL